MSLRDVSIRQVASPPSSPTAWERKGAGGGKVRAALTPTPLLQCRRGGSWCVNAVALTDAGTLLLRSSPFLVRSVGEIHK
jgi:hypothetical protein